MTSSEDRMNNSSGPSTPLPRPTRSSDNRVLSGVCGGLGARYGIDPDLVRAGFVVLTFAGGVGAVVYGAAWIAAREDHAVEPVDPLPVHRQVAVALMFLGTLLVLRSLGLWFGDRVVVPVALVAFGLAAVAARQFGEDRDWLSRISSDRGPDARVRVIVGAVLLVGGATVLLGSIDAIEQAGLVALAMAVTAIGLFLVLGPWLFRLASDLSRERRERIRADERAEVAAHLHDSVLQTLSLIQRTDDPRRAATLARAQERELRDWLYGTGSTPGKLHASIRETAERVEQEYDVPVDVVAVGDDAGMNDRTRALSQAVGEAITNAAKHSGTRLVSVFLERDGDRVDVFVTDQGSGFDAATVPSDRHGVVSSIVGRMQRVGGGAEVTSTVGEGTEVHLWVKP
jgi:signal transduction histidine kinase/phage shock protein PspC (stress-responsive transcriptional regulator)